MTQNTEVKSNAPIMHIARMQSDGDIYYLLLRKIDPHTYTWFRLRNSEEVITPISSSTIPQAIQLASKQWKEDGFRTVNCGFRYTLPERDEHGCNALFHQMVSSYNSMNGVYFDEELGHNCIVNFASSEGRDLWSKLKKDGLL